MRPEFQRRTTIGDDIWDRDIRDLEVIETANGPYLLASNGVNGGLASFDIAGTAHSLRDAQLHENATLRTGDAVPIDGGTGGVVMGGTRDNQLLSYRVGTDGQISAQAQTVLPDVGGAGLRAVAEIGLAGGRSGVFAVLDTGQLAGWQIEDDAQRSVEIPDGATHSQIAKLAVADFGDSALLLVAEGNPGVLTSYIIDPVSGDITQGATFGPDQGLATATPTELVSFTAHGSTWAVMAASGSHSLTLFNLSEGGEIRFADQVADTHGSRFAGVTAIDEISVAGQQLILVAGGDDGLSVLRLLPEGRLVHVTTLAHQPGDGLENPTAISTTLADGYLQIFVASQSSGGIAQFTVPLGDIGISQNASGSSLTGSTRDDVLTGRDGATTLRGGTGDDMLISRSAGDELIGGAGADVFVFHQIDGRVTVSDFEAGSDRLDLSLIPDLRNPQQLTHRATLFGAVLRYQDSELRLYSTAGLPLAIADLWADEFHWLDKSGLGDVSADGVIYGGGGSDTLSGTALDDEIQGQSGADLINGLAGNDLILAGDGADIVTSGAGQDTIFGGLGSDNLDGGDAADRIYGEQGNDSLLGGAGEDALWGGADNDHLSGGLGDDTLSGGDGHDELRGNRGADHLSGGGGNDLIKGLLGPDTLIGGDGNDTLKGGPGDDHLEGGVGDDLLKGKRGDDRLIGGDGNDKLKGNLGADYLSGGSGDDRLDGGADNDTLEGGAGADIFMFKRHHGVDRITDFTQGDDVIDLRFLGQGGIKRFANLEMEQVGEDVVIRTRLGEIWLSDTSLGAMDGGDFLF